MYARFYAIEIGAPGSHNAIYDQISPHGPSTPHEVILQVLLEKAGQTVKGNKLYTIVEIDVASTRYPDQLLGLSSKPMGLLTEFARVGLVTGDEEEGSRRNSVDVVEGVKVEELDLARARRVSRGVR